MIALPKYLRQTFADHYNAGFFTISKLPPTLSVAFGAARLRTMSFALPKMEKFPIYILLARQQC